MNLLASKLAAALCLISCIFFYVLILLGTTSKHNTVDTMNLIKLPGISLSTSHAGNRILEYSDESNGVYMGIYKDTYSGFVYAE